MLPPALRAARFAVVDLETTGLSAVSDRVTEVAAVLIEDGRIAETFEALVDPGIPIPPFVTRLTGIDGRLVAGKPRLEMLLPRLRTLLDGRTFVAHNASFDAAFLKHGFARVGADFQPHPLCTVRLARRLVPGLHSYKLDALLRHLEIPYQARHRAGADAESTALLLLRLLELAETAGASTMADLLRLQERPIAGRARRSVDEAIVASLPQGPGVYLLKDAEGQVLYVGKSRHVRARVREHLRGDNPGQPRLRKRLRWIVDVEAIETGSELEALFLESKLIKRYLPEANVVGRGWRSYPFLAIDLDDPFPRLEVTRDPPAGDVTLFGPLRRTAAVAAATDLLQDHLGLRRCAGPLRPGMSACALLDLKKCLGPCIREEARPAYARAVTRALDLLEGRDDGLLDELVAKRDRLAEALRFEAAAEVRDHVRTLEGLLGDQRRLEAVAQRNLVVVAPSREAGCRELFFIRAGRLCEQRRLRQSARADSLRRALRACFVNAPAPADLDREVVDEMRQLEGWLRRERAVLRTVAVDPAAPEAAVPALQAALRDDAATGPPRSERKPAVWSQPGEPIYSG